MAEFLKLKKSNCKNCYKCIRHCPVKSIRFSGNQAHIVGDECILCGQCFVVCPQNAKQIVDETELADVLLGGDSPVIASIAPSFKAYFEGVGITSLREALIKLGFTDAEETALGATMVKREYERLLREEERDVIITSCCHTVNLLVEKYYPNLIGCLAPVKSPMQAHCEDIKRRIPGAVTIFIGPCLSKKDEAYNSSIDAALTFDELAAMFSRAGITPESKLDNNDESRARLFPTTGGILGTMTYKNPDYTYLTVDGIENCKAVLHDIENGDISRCFIEMSSCSGSCVGGPIMAKYRNSPVRHYKAVTSYAGERDFAVVQPLKSLLIADRQPIVLNREYPSETEIAEIMRKMGKFTPADELNCGTCGYDTCREKAIAIYQGKAEINMCLPYLMDKSERFSNNILDNTPNGILVVNESLEVQEVNPAAMRMLNIRYKSDVLGEPVVRLIDPTLFLDAIDNKRPTQGKRSYFAEYDKYLEQTIVYDRTAGSLILLLRDITDEETERADKAELSRQTVEVADRVVEKQMRIVQEIASLLGETAAETKIALTKLKESVNHDQK
jgi:Iron only hydrogenase large subunit, C-terminal domain